MPKPDRVTNGDREVLNAVVRAVLDTSPEHTGTDGTVTWMRTPHALPMYCAVCARDAALLWARSEPTEGDVPRFMPVALGQVRLLPDGSYEVPIARGVAAGNSVCMPHLLMPDVKREVTE
jgi:hypothetical protein